MTILERLTLIKAGYSKAEIKAMEELEKNAPKEEPKEDPKEEPKEDPKEEPKEDPKEEPKAEPNYKELYEKSIETINSLQAQNNKKDITGNEPSIDDQLVKMFQEFY